MKKLFLVYLTVLVSFSACIPVEDIPIEPEINFKSFVVSGTSADLTIEFTDGDGNIGLDQGDTSGVFCSDTCFYHWNCFCEYYELQNGTWEHIFIDWTDENSIPFYYRIPRVEPTGQNPSLVGEIKLEMPFYYLISPFDTARFEIKIVDRDLNVSNTVISDVFVKP